MNKGIIKTLSRSKLFRPLSLLKQYTPKSKALSQLQSEFNLVMHTSGDAVYRLRYDSMSYDYISPNIKTILGYSAKELQSLNFRSLISETKIISDFMYPVKDYSDLEKIRKNGDVHKWQADYLMRAKNGKRIWVTDISRPWFDKKGSVIGSIGSLRDITDRVNAENFVKNELVRLAHTDALTGIANRRYFFERLEEELRRIKRLRNQCSMLLIDIDHFKKINDQYGHNNGDKVIQSIANNIKKSLRDTDIAARIAGEEFAALLPDTDEAGAYWVADRICSKIAKTPIQLDPHHPPIQPTVSIGLSTATDLEETSSKSLYKFADTRLYIAKNTGRNQVSADEIVHYH